MDIKTLQRGVVLDGLHEDKKWDDFKIFAAGPIFKQPITVAYRIVMAEFNGELIVWKQFFPDYEIGKPDFSNYYMLEGDYFSPDHLEEAMKNFAERVRKQSEYAGTMYRPGYL